MAAAAADAAALAAARAVLEVTSEGNGSEEDPSELGGTGKDLKESECVKIVKSSAEGGSAPPLLVP